MAPIAFTTPSTAATMPSAGSRSGPPQVGLQLVMADRLDFFIHGFDLMRPGVAHRDGIIRR